MGLFEKLFPKKVTANLPFDRWETLTAYKAAFTTWRGEIYEFDQVRSAIDCLARNSAKLRPVMTGTAKPRLRTAIKSQPNPYQTWYQFLYRTRTIWEMQNNAIIIPILDEYDETTGLFTVLPSEVYENCPFTVMESQMYGTPVLGANIGGIPELIRVGETGELFESGNATELKEKINSLWHDTNRQKEYALHCKNHGFDDVEMYVQKMMEYYL